MEDQLRLDDFKVLYRALKRDIPWFDHLLFAVIMWLEELVVSTRVKEAVKDAIQTYEVIDPPVVSLPDPVYTEVDSPTSELLPEMRLQAPWRRD